MELQSGISYEINQQKVGQTLKVLFDKKEADYLIGRSEFDSPEVDNEVVVRDGSEELIGKFAQVKIDRADHYDLYGSIIQ